jgi:hypothetical protein
MSGTILASVTEPPCGMVNIFTMLSTVAMAIIIAHSTKIHVVLLL